MKIIINADDFGLTGGISDSIIQLLQQNALSNTTVMVCTQGVEEQCQKLKDAKLSHKAGVHLQLTLEEHHKKALSKLDEIPSSLDKNEDFMNPDEVELEFENQIQKFIDIFGHNPTHLDSHHSVHLIPTITPICLKLAQKYNLTIRGGREKGQIDGTKWGVRATALNESEWTGQNAPIETLKQNILKGLEKAGEGVLEIVTHPGFCDKELIKASSWNKVRENDHKVLLDLAKEGWLTKMGIELLSHPHF